MLSLSYTIDKHSILASAKHHSIARRKFSRYYFPLLGSLSISYGCYMLWETNFKFKLPIIIPITILIILGLRLLFRNFFIAKNTAKTLLKGQSKEIQTSLTCSDESIIMKTDNSESTVKWSAFIDYAVRNEGVLLYPQKNIFIWIPKSDVTGGSWDDFVDMIGKNIEQKI